MSGLKFHAGGSMSLCYACVQMLDVFLLIYMTNYLLAYSHCPTTVCVQPITLQNVSHDSWVQHVV